MARLTLSIETNDAAELAAFAAAIAGVPPLTDAAEAALQAGAYRPAETPQPSSAPAETPKPAEDAAPAKKSGRKAAAPKAEETAPVAADPFANQSPAAPAAEAAASSPAASAGTASPSEVTYDMLKDTLTAALRKVGPAKAQALIREHGAGAPGLTQLAPESYGAVHAALKQAAEA